MPASQKPDGTVTANTKRLASRFHQIRTGALPIRAVPPLDKKPAHIAVLVFFCLFITRMRPIRSWRGYVQSVSSPLSAQWRHVASSPLPSREDKTSLGARTHCVSKPRLAHHLNHTTNLTALHLFHY